MATAVGAGFDISKLLDSITKADEALTKLMNKNNQASRSIITSFQQIANQGVVPYTQSLEKNLSIYKSIRDAITDTSGKAKRGFGDMKSEIDKVINSTETLMTSLSRSPEFKFESQKKAAQEYRDFMVRMYTEMFDTIERREQQNKSAKQNSKSYAQNYQQQLSAYERLFDEAIAREDKKKKEQSERDAKREAEEHKRKIDNINKRFELIERRNKRDAQRQTEYLNSPKGALSYVRYLNTGVKSINTMNQALQQLRNAQASVNTNTEEGRKKYNELGVAIKRVETEMRAVSGASDEVKKKHSKLMDTSGQLMRAMTAIFSVSAIKGYINKLREVRGEFEMQQRSLQILLQNKDKANELWEKTIDLAVKSPFRVKELVTYTKQLAAYRVESDKLYDTTKMLADVSAGLGVDMNRLILAFGQVKAANFLRGTELRQFTEAGIPMLDELAKLFTELEGRAVSAGEVFERISKRMVTFGDVEEVFNRITSAGGVFYNMQEEQSKTLAGLYANLHDSIDLMLNDIGKANDGILKGSINVAKEFVENWREVSVVLEQIVLGLTTYKLSSAAFAIGLKNTTNATLRFNNALTWADAKAIGFTKSQFLLTKALNATKIAANGVKVAVMQIMLPALLIGGIAKLVQMMTKASREAKRLKKDLNEIFNEDTSNLERQNDTFKDLVERLKDVNTGSKEHKNIISQLNNQYGEYIGFIVDEKTTYDKLASSINSVTTALTQKAKAASYEKALSRLYEDTEKDISDSMSKIEERFKRGFFRASGPNIIPTDEEIQDIFALIQKEVSNTGKKIGDGLDLGSILSEYYGEDVIFSATEQHKHLLEYSEAILKRKEEEEKIQKRINNLYDDGLYSTKEYRDEMEKLNKAKEEELSNEKSRSGREKIEYKYKVEEVRLQGRYEGLDDAAIQKRVDQIQKVSTTVADINRRMGEEADKFGQDAIDRVYITFQDASQGVDAIAEQTAASYKSMQQEIKDQNALKEAGTIHDQAALDNAMLMSKVYYRMLEIMGKTELAKEKGADSKELKRLKEQIKLIRDAAKAYDDMRKLHDDAYASERIVKDYGKAFKEAGLGEIGKYSFGTREDERNNLKKLEDSASRVKGGMLELSTAIAQVSVNMDDANKELSDKKLFDAISDIFSDYEISLEMDKLNIPSDLAEQLFGFESIDLNEIRGKVLEKFGLGSMVGTSNQGIYDSNEFKAMSKERQDELRKSLEKESELQDNALKERLKTYTQYLKKEQDERIKIKLEELRKLEEVEGMNEFNEEQKAVIKNNIRSKADAELLKNSWESFEKSPDFLNLFDDISRSTTQSLVDMRTQLDELRSSMLAAELPASDLKEILDKIVQVEEELDNREPFNAMKEDWKTLFGTEYKKALEDEKRLLEERNALRTEQKKIEKSGPDDYQLNILNSEKEKLESMVKGTEEYEAQKQLIADITASLYPNQQRYNEILELLKQNGIKLDEVQQKTRAWKDACLDIAESFNEIGNAVNQVGGALGTTLEQLGLMSEESKAIYDSHMNMANDLFGLGSNVMQLVANPTNPQAWVGAITNVISFIGNIAATGDAVREKEIQAEMKKAYRLEKAYEKLEKAMDEAYTTDQMRANKASMEQNIDEQIKALESANAKEEAKKKKDQDQIDANYEKIAELEEKKAELQRETVERLGGTYDYAGVAEQFLDAWLEAFKETGDGLSGLEDNFDEFFSDLAKKQIVYGGLTTIIDNLQKKINADLTDNQRIDNWRDIIDEYNKTITNIDEFLTGVVSNLKSAGLDIFSGDGSELSGLSKGIQGMTEETSNILAAYWNAVRFDVSAIRQRFDEYLATQGLSEDANPMMNVLNSQLEQLKAIRGVLDDAITGGDSTTGAFRVRVVEMN